MAKKQEQTNGVEVVVRECDHLVTTIGNRKSLKWQAHAYLTDKVMQEPIISGNPETSRKLAIESLEKALNEYLDLSIKAKAKIADDRKKVDAMKKAKESKTNKAEEK